jgi:hypothetical protein
MNQKRSVFAYSHYVDIGIHKRSYMIQLTSRNGILRQVSCGLVCMQLPERDVNLCWFWTQAEVVSHA